ncbi:hypothetical protein Mesop_4338 [Mesorhizobium opportunistum WSM2075]|uniref:Uncharacterized protein n=1 Tax=Mesorhizobium opportunistum (strain LMG 24607 / HAMBI 3007 / WSM2075) TaxID=536019 RepID=F7Y9P2_MESOW|nr:hypothetical protein Mesop_4338 [Mesorhizobium opportunistum WSM2075]
MPRWFAPPVYVRTDRPGFRLGVPVSMLPQRNS